METIKPVSIMQDSYCSKIVFETVRTISIIYYYHFKMVTLLLLLMMMTLRTNHVPRGEGEVHNGGLR